MLRAAKESVNFLRLERADRVSASHVRKLGSSGIARKDLTHGKHPTARVSRVGSFLRVRDLNAECTRVLIGAQHRGNHRGLIVARSAIESGYLFCRTPNCDMARIESAPDTLAVGGRGFWRDCVAGRSNGIRCVIHAIGNVVRGE